MKITLDIEEALTIIVKDLVSKGFIKADPAIRYEFLLNDNHVVTEIELEELKRG